MSHLYIPYKCKKYPRCIIIITQSRIITVSFFIWTWWKSCATLQLYTSLPFLCVGGLLDFLCLFPPSETWFLGSSPRESNLFSTFVFFLSEFCISLNSEFDLWTFKLHLKYDFKLKNYLTGECQIFLKLLPLRKFRLHPFAFHSCATQCEHKCISKKIISKANYED